MKKIIIILTLIATAFGCTSLNAQEKKDWGAIGLSVSPLYSISNKGNDFMTNVSLGYILPGKDARIAFYLDWSAQNSNSLKNAQHILSADIGFPVMNQKFSIVPKFGIGTMLLPTDGKMSAKFAGTLGAELRYEFVEGIYTGFQIRDVGVRMSKTDYTNMFQVGLIIGIRF